MPADTPEPQHSPMPPPPAGPPPEEDRASGGRRALAVLLALVLAFAGAVMIAVAIDIGDSTTCEDFPSLSPEEQLLEEFECFDGSSAQKTASVILAWASGIVGAIAVLVALAFALTGRRGRLLLQATAAAVLLGALSIAVGSI